MICLQMAKMSIETPPLLMPQEFDLQPLHQSVTELLLKESEVQPNHP